MKEKFDEGELEKLRTCGALPRGYIPKTELGWKLIRLRAQHIAKGGRFLSEAELEKKIAEMRE
jgi:hypothetical protein